MDFDPTTVSPDYDKFQTRWQRCRDAYDGEDAIKARKGTGSGNKWSGTAYLPALSGHNEEDYNSYRDRATWFNATNRTVQGLQGMLFRKPMQMSGVEVIEEDLKDVTMAGDTVRGFAQALIKEVLLVGRAGVLIDYPTGANPSMSMSEAERLNLRPFWRMYKTENILNYKEAWLGNRTVLSMVSLQEVSQDGKQQIRILKLSESDEDGLPQERHTYRQEVWQLLENAENKGSKSSSWQLVETITPKMQGKPLEEIPFVFFTQDSLRPRIEDIPIYDLVVINISHYRNSADYEHGIHYTALPTPWAAGFSVNAQGGLKIGSTEAWVTDNPSARAGFLEFTGAGLNTLKESMEGKESKMAALGSRVLAPEKRIPETAESAAIHRSGENSILAKLAANVSDGLAQLVEIHIQWRGLVPVGVSIEINRDFLPTEMPYGAIYALISAVQKGLIAHSDAIGILKDGEYLDPSRTVEDIQAEWEVDPIRKASLLEGVMFGGGGAGEGGQF